MKDILVVMAFFAMVALSWHTIASALSSPVKYYSVKTGGCAFVFMEDTDGTAKQVPCKNFSAGELENMSKDWTK